jgi:hypothetical protein
MSRCHHPPHNHDYHGPESNGGQAHTNAVNYNDNYNYYNYYYYNDDGGAAHKCSDAGPYGHTAVCSADADADADDDDDNNNVVTFAIDNAIDVAIHDDDNDGDDLAHSRHHFDANSGHDFIIVVIIVIITIIFINNNNNNINRFVFVGGNASDLANRARLHARRRSSVDQFDVVFCCARLCIAR